MIEALLEWLGPCENYTRGDCRGNGRGPRDSKYGAERWCAPCEVRDRLPAIIAAATANLDAALAEWDRVQRESPTIAARNRGAATILRRLAAISPGIRACPCQPMVDEVPGADGLTGWLSATLRDRLRISLCDCGSKSESCASRSEPLEDRACGQCGSAMSLHVEDGGFWACPLTVAPDRLTDWQRYAGTLSDTLLALGHHNAATHQSPDQYDSESGLACIAPGCLSALRDPTAPRERVNCDDGCGAFRDPRTPDEYRAAHEHWRDHGYLSGCSHGN